jgi:signal transduction histidine kinase
VAFWSASYALWQFSISRDAAYFWLKMLTAGSILIPIFYYQFTVYFLQLEKRLFYRISIIAGYFLAFLFLVLTPSSLLVEDLEQKFSFVYWPNAGQLYIFFIVFFAFFFLMTAYIYLRGYQEEQGIKKEQIKYLLLGTGVGFIGGATNFPLWYDIPVLPYGNILVSIYVLFTAYAIIAHRLLNIKFVLKKSSVIVFSLVVVFAAIIPFKFFFDRYTGTVSFWGDIVIIVVAIYIYPYLREWFNYAANKYFFTSLYDGRKVITQLSDSLRVSLDTNYICDSLYDILGEAFHFQSFAVLSYDDDKGKYKIEFNRGFAVSGVSVFSGNDMLHKKFVSQGKAMIVEELDRLYGKTEAAETIKLLKEMKADVLMPLNVKDKTIGLLVLGPKETGDMYNDEDIQILEIAGAQAAIAIENAWLFEETKRFNVKLKQEVDRATADLKQANTKLKRLDVAKSEFISIASHQLRTPLTVIKGYISMILEGSFGKISKTQKESLEKVYESSERLIQLIENLLNISRIESGRLQYSFMPLDLEKLVANVVEELESVAKKKGLRFTYKKPKTALPTLKLDEEKLRQVIMNLIDNSIKYTKQGSVTVSLYQKDNRVIFSVKDTGIGIDEEGKDNLFKKFSRGTGTSLIHTEGTGLGLYVAKQIVEGHGGDIRVESPGEGKGSEFLVALPVAKEGE